MTVAGWRAWYADGSTATSNDDDYPRDGCVGFMVYYDEFAAPGVRYRDQVKGGDWYVVRPCGLVERHGTRHDGEWDDEPSLTLGEVLVKSAPSMPDEEWERTYAEMLESSWP